MKCDWQRIDNPQKIDKRVSNYPEEVEDIYNTLARIIDIPNAPGFEHGMARELVKIFKPLCDSVHIDHVGNVYAKREGAPNGPVIICPAHSDSVSFIVEYIEPNGYIRFCELGIIPPYLSYGQRMVIITPNGPITGVNGTQAGHSHFNWGGADGKYYPSELVATPMFDEQYIDVGAKSREEVLEMGIRPGQQIVYDRDLRWLGDGRTGMVTARGLDDKVGLAVLIETLKELEDKEIYPTVYMVGASQEEIGCVGASAAGIVIDADLCIGVDGTISEAGPQTNNGFGVGDSPNITLSEVATSVGEGVYISVHDMAWGAFGGLMGNQKINEKLIEIAEKRNIDYAIEGNMAYVSSDPSAIQHTGFGGTPSVTLKIPMRYTHGPVEVCSLLDGLQAVKLLTGFIEELDSSFNLSFVDIPEADKGPNKNRKPY